MTNLSQPDYLTKAKQAGRQVVADLPKFDLDAYIANYKGKTRFDRLFLIGTTSQPLAIEALRSAVAEAKRGKDVSRYNTAVSTLHEVVPGDPSAITDTVWVEKTAKQVKAESDRLELELKGYKNNLIKESIRMGYDDLGQHHHRTGDLVNSTKSYARMRDYCTTPSHIVIMNLRLISVSIDQGNWLAVQTNVQKLRTPGQKIVDAERLSAKLSAAMGLALLSSGNYYEAALEFIGTDPRMIQARLDDPDDEEAFNEVMTPNDVAIYGGLCALASMNRNDLQKKVLDNNTFRNYLELEPHIRRAIASFVSSKYSSCLSILESYRTDYLLDLHLHCHLPELYSQIRSKAVQQYFIPFSRVTLSALATAFDTDEQTMEAEVTGMIKQGHLNGRIDLVDRVLCANSVEARQKVHKEALAMARDYEQTAHLRILRLEMTNAGLEIMDKSKAGGPMSAENVIGDHLYGNGAMNQWLGDSNSGGNSGGKSLRSSLRG